MSLLLVLLTFLMIQACFLEKQMNGVISFSDMILMQNLKAVISM